MTILEIAICRFVIRRMERGWFIIQRMETGFSFVFSPECFNDHRSSPLSSTERHVAAAVACVSCVVAHRTADDTRHKTAADLDSRACTCARFDRDAKRADLTAAG